MYIGDTLSRLDELEDGRTFVTLATPMSESDVHERRELDSRLGD